MIAVDQMKVSDTLMIGGRASYLGRRSRTGYPPYATSKKRTFFEAVVGEDRERDWRSNQRHRLPYQLVRQLRGVDRRLSQSQGREEIGQGRVEVNEGDELGQGRQEGAEVTYNDVKVTIMTMLKSAVVK